MIELKNTCIGVRCAICNKNIVEYINRFQFASGTELFCPYCNSHILSIKKRDLFNMSINCFACSETHAYSISANSFFSENIASYGCKNNKVDIFFTGSHDDVDIALHKLSKELKILTDRYYDNFRQLYGSLNTDALRILGEKASEKRIICLCGSNKINLKISVSGIYLICPSCGSSEFIPVGNEEDVQALKERRSILIR